jgi:hypothetical protein
MDEDFQRLLVWQLGGFVKGTVDWLHNAHPDLSVLDLEAEVYRLLARSCKDRADLAEAFAKGEDANKGEMEEVPAPQNGLTDHTAANNRGGD